MKVYLVFITLLCAIYAAPPPLKSMLKARDFLPTPPSQDPFYSPPPGYESQPLGAILKTRKLDHTVGLVVIPFQIKEVYQFIIRSEDTFGNPLAVATALYIPYNADPNKLLSYQVAEDASNLDCAPSYAFQLGSNPISIVSSQLEQVLVQAGLEEGWYVVVPDYEGPNAAFGSGQLAGRAVLNSVRAVLQSGNITGLASNPKIAYWGYSGGSLATGWAALFEPTYAPELSLQTIGYAYGGIVADVAHVAKQNVGNIFAGLLFAAMNGLSHEYPSIKQYIADNVYPDKQSFFALPNKLCEIVYIPLFLFKGWDEFFRAGSATLSDPIVKNITDLQNMITSSLVPTAPLYFYNAIYDEIIPADDADKLYSRLCAAGVDIEYNQDLLGGHIVSAVTGAGSAFSWLKDRFNGIPVNQGCKKTFTFTSAVTPAGLTGFSDIIVSTIMTILQKPIGPPSLGLSTST